MNKKFVDYYPNMSLTLEYIKDCFISTFKTFGYQPIETSTFEDYEKMRLLNGSNSIKFIDSDGSIIALRNEFTPKVAEIVSKVFHKFYPVKYYYYGRAYQLMEEEAGDLREFFQAGVENFHKEDSIFIDIEILVLAIESLLKLGIQDFTIDIGEVNFFKGISSDYGIDDISSENLCKLIDRKDFIGVENFLLKKGISSKVIDIFRNLTRLYGKKDRINEAKRFAKNEISKLAIERLETIFDKLSKLGYERYISMDFGMLKHLNYYTGIIFSGYLNELGYPILNGGRYDNLCKNFGEDLHAIGFAFGVDRILNWMYKNKEGEVNPFESAIFYDKESLNKAYEVAFKVEESSYFYSKPVSFDEAIDISKILEVRFFYYIENETIKKIYMEDILK